ncbi:MAG: SRPBCC family protein [Verrucomicrobia bacterium]|nr:SRPBCC family protein [Verrucomicrobiota bacterium]
MSHSASPARPSSDREVISTRHFTPPPEKVFAAFADPVRLAKWWGPVGFSNVIREFDLRVGGQWRVTMIAPNGVEYHNVSTFVEITPPAKIVYQHEEPVHGFRMTMTFEPHGTGTTLTWRMRFDSAKEVAKIRDFIVIANEQNFDRLQGDLSIHG